MLAIVLFLSLFLLFYFLTGGEMPEKAGLVKTARDKLFPGISAAVFFIAGSAMCRTALGGIPWAVFGWFLPGWVVGAVAERRRARLRDLAKSFVVSAAGMFAAGQTASEVMRVMAGRMPEPFAGDFQDMVGQREMQGKPFSRSFGDLAKKYGLPEFEAVGAVLAAADRAGGPAAAAKGLKRLGAALQQRDRLLAERRKETFEPKVAAGVVIVLLLLGFLGGVLLWPQYFEGGGRLVLAAASTIIVGMVFLAVKAGSQDAM
ncbi:type II secretion system F domain-containing protein [Moorella thermoacetica Y72]|uniref:Type II secretion system F domain-containing protein n=1 Tax=Moorella thermoacetica Y72 TaxID=1325331 RepID=A0A0S6U7M5_NEOTH|nr:type II secretion system F family protein [Moorella thermoacetica]GAF24709.1 type II secretion system F domain-containing protein [Moorella thermoacetica Y72]